MVTKHAEAQGRSGNPQKSKYREGKHDAFNYLVRIARDEEGTPKKQFANWTNIAAGIHSTTSKYVLTASEFRLFPQLTNSWLLTTSTHYQYSGYYTCCLEYCLHRVTYVLGYRGKRSID